MRRIAGAVALSVGWAVAWAGIGVLIRVADRGGSIATSWLGPEIGLAPGFLVGVLFSWMLAIAAGGRGLATSPLALVVACGAIAGLAVGVLPFVINEPPSGAPLWRAALVVIGSMAVLGALSAGGSLAVLRSATTARR